MNAKHLILLPTLLCLLFLMLPEMTHSDEPTNYRELIFNTGKLKPVDSILKIKVGDVAPDFILPSIQGMDISLRQYRGQKNVVLSFVPAAWTPVCSDQWPKLPR